jgi:two-component system cell cycle sensor histidine kinase/response regulator CckA
MPAEKPVTPLRVLIVKDSAPDAELVVAELRQAGFEPTYEVVDSAPGLRAALDRQTWDVVLCDESLTAFDATSALQILRESSPDLPVIIVSGSERDELAVDAIRGGADDYVLKGSLTRLTAAVAREVGARAAREEHRRVEAQLRRSQRVEAIGQLAGGIAHDFNNLLTVILSYSESLLAQLELADPLRVEVIEIQRAGHRAAALTRQLLAFGRQQHLDPQVVDVNEIVTGIEQLLQRVIGEHIELNTKLTTDAGRVRVDVSQMENVLLNLAVNARDAMPRGGALLIETSNVSLDATTMARMEGPEVPPGDYVVLTVADTGCGMDAETRARAFEPFFTTKESGRGTGLGLPMVYGTVTQSGGSISIDSDVGRGTTVKMLLPRVFDGADRETAVSTPAPAAGSETILVVEDEELVRQTIVRTLERLGYRVLVARDGQEAISLAAAWPGRVDLVITDVVMPRMGGEEVVARLRRTRPSVRVLYVSGYTERVLLRTGTESFLRKPFVTSVLAMQVRALLRSGPNGPGDEGPSADASRS